MRAVQRIEAGAARLLHATLHFEAARAGRTDDRDRDRQRVWIKHLRFLCSPSARPTASPRKPNRLGTFGVRGPSAYDVLTCLFDSVCPCRIQPRQSHESQ
jgi:hypothetical protein